jgi:hypothetical protein
LTVIATVFVVALLLTLQTRSPSQAASLESIANNTSTSTDILPEAHTGIAELAVGMPTCSGVWVIETIDSTGNTGSQTSLALEPVYPYIPHISYQANPSGDPGEAFFLKYVRLSDTTWVSETIDSGGDGTSLALAPTYPYSPCISYHDWWEWDLRYACLDGTTWNTMTVIGGIRSTVGGMALEPTYPYTPHISVYNSWGTLRNLGHAYLSGTTWCSGRWLSESVEPAYSETGSHSSLVLERTEPYIPHIGYYDSVNKDLKHAWLSGTTWLSETVDSAGDVGLYPSLALDSRNYPHISYYDDTNDTLKYAWLDGTTWLSETVDSIGQQVTWSRRGATSLALDQTDASYISYYDATNGDLKLAYSDGTAWLIQIVDRGSDVGQYSSLTLDQLGCPHISYYDATNGDLKYASLKRVNYLPVILKN